MDEEHVKLGSPTDAWIRKGTEPKCFQCYCLSMSISLDIMLCDTCTPREVYGKMNVEQDKYRQINAAAAQRNLLLIATPPPVVYRVHAVKFSKKLLPWIQQLRRQAEKNKCKFLNKMKQVSGWLLSLTCPYYDGIVVELIRSFGKWLFTSIFLLFLYVWFSKLVKIEKSWTNANGFWTKECKMHSIS